MNDCGGNSPKRNAKSARNQEKIILNKARDKERRNRTRRLIEHDAIQENVLSVKDLDGSKINALLMEIFDLPVVSKIRKPPKDNGQKTWTLNTAHIIPT